MKKLLTNKTVLLFGGMALNVLLGYAIVKLNTAYLSLEAFGMLSLFMNFILFARVFFSVGIFESSSRILATEKDKKSSSEIFGATITVTFFMGILLSLSIYLISFFIDTILEVKIGFLLRLLWPLTFVLLFQNMLQVVLRGFGYIGQLSAYFFTARLFYIAAIGALIYTSTFHLVSSATSFLLSILITVFIFALLPRPTFGRLKHRMRQIKEEVISYGRHLYFANILTAFFYHSDKLLLAYFLDARQVGYYALAFTISAPIPYFSNALSTTSFRQFANQTAIQSRKLRINFIYVTIVTGILLIFNKFIIEDLFSAAFAPAIPTLKILIIAFAVNALSVPYTMFFKARKRGREIRNITLISQIVFLTANLVLIPLIGIKGAAVATLSAYSLDFLLYLILYIRK